MDTLPTLEYYEGIVVDFKFEQEGPMFGDLFTICGFDNPNFPPPNKFDFSSFEKFEIEQVDDFFGILNGSDEGTDVILWLFPLVKHDEVAHHPGPFDGLRLNYPVLCNPQKNAQLFLQIVHEFNEFLPVTLTYKNKECSLDQVSDIVQNIIDYWDDRGITVGSGEALRLDVPPNDTSTTELEETPRASLPDQTQIAPKSIFEKIRNLIFGPSEK